MGPSVAFPGPFFLIFLKQFQHICCGYSKDGPFEHQKLVLKLMDKEIFTILPQIFCLSQPAI